MIASAEYRVSYTTTANDDRDTWRTYDVLGGSITRAYIADVPENNKHYIFVVSDNQNRTSAVVPVGARGPPEQKPIDKFNAIGNASLVDKH